jgi:hypothetical protein
VGVYEEQISTSVFGMKAPDAFGYHPHSEEQVWLFRSSEEQVW